MEELTTIEEAQNDLISCAIYLAEQINSNEGQAEAFKPIVLQYLEKEDVDSAAHFADVINDSFVRNQLLVAVIAKCVELDDDEYAGQLIEAIDEYGMQATAKEAFALQKALKGDFSKALEVADSLEHSSNAFAGIAINQTKKGHEDEALATLKRIDFHKVRVEALVEMAINFLREENYQKANVFLERAIDEAEQIEFAEDKIRALIEIGNYFIESKRKDTAIETFAKAGVEAEKLDGLHRESLYASIAVGYLKAGSLDLADRTLDDVSDLTQVANCLLGFSQVFEQDGELEEALETLEEAYAILKSQPDAEIRDSKARFQLFSAIATQFAKLEKIERALEVAHENPVELQKNFALTNIAQVCVLQGNDEMAHQAIKGIESDSQRLSALVALSDAKNQTENKQAAIGLLDEAATMIETVPQYIARSETENELSKRYAFYGETEIARKIASDSLNTIGKILGNENRAFALTDLAKVYDKYDFKLSAEDLEILETLVRNTAF
jgi:tetratricopeptide (TPR) repeat protein